jgi:hypothetical protein
MAFDPLFVAGDNVHAGDGLLYRNGVGRAGAGVIVNMGMSILRSEICIGELGWSISSTGWSRGFVMNPSGILLSIISGNK